MGKNYVDIIQKKEFGYNKLLLEIFLSHPIMITFLILLSFLEILFAIISPLVMRSLIDDVLVGKNFGLLYPLLLIFSIIFIISALSLYFSTRIKGNLDIILFNALSLQIFDRVQMVEYSELQQLKTGDLQFRTTGNVGSIIQIVTSTIPQILVTVSGIFLPVFIMLSLDFTLTIIVISPSILFVFFSLYFGNEMKAKQRPALDSNANLQSFLKESYSSIPLIKVFSLENWMHEKYDQHLAQYADKSVNLIKVSSISSTISMLIYGIPSILVISLGSMAVIQGTMTIGTLTAFIGYVALFFSPIQQISFLWNNYKSTQASYERINEILELKAEQNGDDLISITKGEIKFENVWFYYNSRIILKELNITFARGRNYIVGDNGSGKTTILKLLCGLYTPDRGRIVLDGQDLTHMSRNAIRTSISVVFSDALIIDGTIYDNILLGNLSTTKEDVISAAKKAKLHDFIMKLPKQYESEVGESGLNLSSGEKQKIALARVILRDSPIIIFDEFTRSIDTESKKSIFSVIKQLTNKTIIIITHDLQDIEKNGRVIVMADCGIT